MFKDRLRAARKSKGYTQETLASQIGVKKTTISGYESGNSEPDMQKLIQLMKVLDVDANYLYQDEMSGSASAGLSEKAVELAAAFDTLNPVGQSLVRSALDFALKHLAGNQPPLKRIGTTLNPTSGQRLPLYEAVCDGTIETKEAAKREEIEITTNPNLTDLPFFEGVEIRIREK